MSLVRVRVDAPAVKEAEARPRLLRVSVAKWAVRLAVIGRTEMVRQIRSRQQSYGRTGRLSNSTQAAADKSGVVIGTTASYGPFVDQPTRPHEIRPVRAKALAFPGGGAGRLGSTRTGKRTAFKQVGTREVRGNVAFARVVRHPGTRGMFYAAHTARALEQPATDLLDATIREDLGRKA